MTVQENEINQVQSLTSQVGLWVIILGITEPINKSR